ncbi:MAG TPA: hypothetical protein DCQ14_06710, partial [Firmicutes bacterium]|nr:hypothetical protein [Bacillota bacterium]
FYGSIIVFLLFTPHWHFTIMLISISAAVMLLDTKTTLGRLTITAGSAVLMALLMKIVLA